MGEIPQRENLACGLGREFVQKLPHVNYTEMGLQMVFENAMENPEQWLNQHVKNISIPEPAEVALKYSKIQLIFDMVSEKNYECHARLSHGDLQSLEHQKGLIVDMVFRTRYAFEDTTQIIKELDMLDKRRGLMQRLAESIVSAK